MTPKDCKRLAEVDFPMPRSTSTRRGTSAVEVWGRGTNRVIEMCEKHGAPLPVFEEKQGFLVVTFRAPLVAGGVAGTSRSESGDQVTAQVTAHVTAEVTAQVAAFCREPQPAKAIMAELGLKHWKTFQTNYLAPLMAMGVLEMATAHASGQPPVSGPLPPDSGCEGGPNRRKKGKGRR